MRRFRADWRPSFRRIPSHSRPPTVAAGSPCRNRADSVLKVRMHAFIRNGTRRNDPATTAPSRAPPSNLTPPGEVIMLLLLYIRESSQHEGTIESYRHVAKNEADRSSYRDIEHACLVDEVEWHAPDGAVIIQRVEAPRSGGRTPPAAASALGVAGGVPPIDPENGIAGRSKDRSQDVFLPKSILWQVENQRHTDTEGI